AFLQYLLQILVAVMMGVFMMMMIRRAVVCAGSIAEVLDSRTRRRIPAGVDELPRRGELAFRNATFDHPAAEAPVLEDLYSTPRRAEREFRNVTCGYPGAEVPVLEDLNFTARPGTTTAIIGSTGSGKSTIVNLIPRLIDPQQGQVLIDGVPVTDFSRQQLAQL